MRNLMLGLVLALTMALGTFTATPAHAEELPSSSTPAINLWKVMHPSTFPGTHKSAVTQCLRDAAVSPVDLLTPQKCELAGQKLASGDYQVVMVPDGIVHNYLNARNSIARNVAKATGRDDRALLLNLGDGVFLYWYTGVKKQSCNNVGISIVIPPVEQAERFIPEVPAPPAAVSYRMKRTGEVVTPGTALTVGGNVYEVFTCPTGCVCKDGVIISTPRVTTGGFPTTSGSFEN